MQRGVLEQSEITLLKICENEIKSVVSLVNTSVSFNLTNVSQMSTMRKTRYEVYGNSFYYPKLFLKSKFIPKIRSWLNSL